MNESENRLGLLVDVHSVRKVRGNLECEVHPFASRNPKAKLQVAIDDHWGGVVSFLHLELVSFSEGIAELLNEGEADPVCLDVGEFSKGMTDGLTILVVTLDFDSQALHSTILDVFPIFRLKNVEVGAVSLSRVQGHYEGAALNHFSVHGGDCSPGLVWSLVFD